MTEDDEDEAEEVIVGAVEVLVDTDTPFEAPRVEVESLEEVVVDDSGNEVNGTAASKLDTEGDAIAVESDSEAIVENATAGDVILRILDVVLLLSERFFGTFLPDFIEVIAAASDNAQKALADPLAGDTQVLGGVRSTLPDEDEAAGQQRNVPKLDAPDPPGGDDPSPGAPDDPLAALWSDESNS